MNTSNADGEVGIQPAFSERVRAAVIVPSAAKLPGADKMIEKTEARPADRKRVSGTLVNLLLDAMLLLVFTALTLVAVIVQFVFPPGVAAKGWVLWNMNFGQWCSLQFALLSVFGFGILVHVMLHWTWVCSVVNRKILHRQDLPDDGIRTLYGVGLLIILLLTGAVVVGFATLTIRMPPQ